MSDLQQDVQSLSFQLEVEEGWPPVAVESLPFRVAGGGYECQVAPLYVKDLAIGDLIEAAYDEDGTVSTWSHLRRSNHSTIWLLRTKSPNNLPDVLRRLRVLGCSTVGLEAEGSYAIDVPGELKLSVVDEVLATLDTNAVATAFPAIRHPEE
jgi:hypothetical protein